MQVSGVTDRGLKPKNMKVVAVLGGGLMGSGIATALAWTGYKVLLKEIKQEFLDGGMQRIKANMDSRVKKKGMTPQQRDAAMARVKGTLTYDDFKVCPVMHCHARWYKHCNACLCSRKQN
jgi:enoyl-CoA hydratase/3-hydroxyacyl-CoA dehydrogenase